MKKEKSLTLVLVMVVISTWVYNSVENYVILNHPALNPSLVAVIPPVVVAIVGYYFVRWWKKQKLP